MSPTAIEEEINTYLGSHCRPYLIPSVDGLRESGCVCWDLPPQKDEDKSISTRYMELTARIVQLVKEDEKNPEVKVLAEKAKALFNGVPVTRRFGVSIVSENDVLRLDERKGIRKEWWDLHAKYSTRGVSVFQGYASTAAIMSKTADLLIVMPGEDQYDFLRRNQTRGNNHLVDTTQIILALTKLEHEFGIYILHATADSVEFIFKTPVEAESRARIRRRLSRLCPSAEDLAASLRLGRVALWWD